MNYEDDLNYEDEEDLIYEEILKYFETNEFYIGDNFNGKCIYPCYMMHNSITPVYYDLKIRDDCIIGVEENTYISNPKVMEILNATLRKYLPIKIIPDSDGGFKIDEGPNDLIFANKNIGGNYYAMITVYFKENRC